MRFVPKIGKFALVPKSSVDYVESLYISTTTTTTTRLTPIEVEC